MIADQAARRGREGDAGLAAARRAHVGHLGLAGRHLLDDRARIFVVDVDHHRLIRLLAGPSRSVAEQHARAADAELEAFAAHRLDQHAELQLAAPGDFESCRLSAASVTLIATLRFAFAQQPVADHAAGDLGALAARHRRIVDRKAHRQRRRIDRLGVERLGHRRGRRWCWRRSRPVRPAIEMMSPAWLPRPARAPARGTPSAWSRGRSRRPCRRGRARGSAC